jgi:hypothetical protein
MARTREEEILGPDPIRTVCMCHTCWKPFESLVGPQILCDFCKEATLVIHALNQTTQNGNLPEMMDRVTKGNKAVTHIGVRPKVLGEA